MPKQPKLSPEAEAIADQFVKEWTAVCEQLDRTIEAITASAEAQTGRVMDSATVLNLLSDALLSKVASSEEPELLLDIAELAIQRFRDDSDASQSR